MEVVIFEDLADKAKEQGEYMLQKLKHLQSHYSKIVKEARGLGLMIGIEFWKNEYGWSFSKGVFKKGVIVSGTLNNSRVIRIEPPLIITKSQIDTATSVMNEVLADMYMTLFQESVRLAKL